MQTLIIYGRLPGLNDYTLKCRYNRYAGASMKKDAEKIISKHIKEQLKGISYEGAVTLDFRWFEPNKRRDFDNICFAKKFILDALNNANVICADSWKGVQGFTDNFFVDKDNPRIEVDIKPLIPFTEGE